MSLKLIIYIIGIAIICYGLLNLSATPTTRLLIIILGAIIDCIPVIVAKIKNKRGPELTQGNK